jgi:hypothetical protein
MASIVPSSVKLAAGMDHEEAPEDCSLESQMFADKRCRSCRGSEHSEIRTVSSRLVVEAYLGLVCDDESRMCRVMGLS